MKNYREFVLSIESKPYVIIRVGRFHDKHYVEAYIGDRNGINHALIGDAMDFIEKNNMRILKSFKSNKIETEYIYQ